MLAAALFVLVSGLTIGCQGEYNCSILQPYACQKALHNSFSHLCGCTQGNSLRHHHHPQRNRRNRRQLHPRQEPTIARLSSSWQY